MVTFDQFKHVAHEIGVTAFPEDPWQFTYGFPDVAREEDRGWDSVEKRWLEVGRNSRSYLVARPIAPTVTHPLFGDLPAGCDTVCLHKDYPLSTLLEAFVWSTDARKWYPAFRETLRSGDIIAYRHPADARTKTDA